MFSFKNINKTYNKRLILKEINLEVEAGKTVVILGKNGAGKSTLMKIIAGATKNDSKLEAYINNKPIRYSSPFGAKKYGIGSIYQAPLFIECMSVWRNFFLFHEELYCGFFLRYKKMQNVVVEEMEKIGIPNINPNLNISILSGGERQCLAIARSLYHNTKLLLLDEPTSALEEKQRFYLIDFLKKSQIEKKISIIMITHSKREAKLLGDTIYMLEDLNLSKVRKDSI